MPGKVLGIGEESGEGGGFGWTGHPGCTDEVSDAASDVHDAGRQTVIVAELCLRGGLRERNVCLFWTAIGVQAAFPPAAAVANRLLFRVTRAYHSSDRVTQDDLPPPHGVESARGTGQHAE